MSYRFRLPAREVLSAKKPRALERSPLLDALRLGEPFACGSAVLFESREGSRCAYASSLEAAAQTALQLSERRATPSDIDHPPTEWSVGFFLGTAPSYSINGDATTVCLVATCWRSCHAAAAAYRGAAGPSASAGSTRLAVVATAAVRVLSTLSAFRLRWHAEQHDDDAFSTVSTDCLLACVAAESGHVENQVVLLSKLVSQHFRAALTPTPRTALTLYTTPRQGGNGRRIRTHVRGVHLTEVGSTYAGGAVGALSIGSNQSGLSRTLVVCADQLGVAADAGLSFFGDILPIPDPDTAVWDTMEAGVRCLASASSAVIAVQATITFCDDQITLAPFRAVLDGSRATASKTSSSSPHVDLNVERPWQRYFEGVNDLFVLANQVEDGAGASPSDLRVLDRFCTAVAAPGTTPGTFWAALVSTVQEVAEATEISDSLMRGVLIALADTLWEAGVRALSSDPDTTTPRTPRTSQDASEVLSLIVTTADSSAHGVLPALVRTARDVLVADSAAEDTRRQWPITEAASVSPCLTSEQSFPHLLRLRPPEGECLATRKRSICVAAVVQRLLDGHGARLDVTPHVSKPLLSKQARLWWRASREQTRQESEARSVRGDGVLPLFGPVDVVYCTPPTISDAVVISTAHTTAHTTGRSGESTSSSVLPCATVTATSALAPRTALVDMMEGLTQLYSTSPHHVFSFSKLANDYLYVAAYGYYVMPSALDDRLPTTPSLFSPWDALFPGAGHDHRGAALYRPLQALRADGRSREACLLCQDGFPGCRPGLVIGTSYAVVDARTCAELSAWALVARGFSVSLIQSVGRAAAARHQVAAMRAQQDGEVLWKQWCVPHAAYWTDLDARRTALLTASRETYGRPALAAAAQSAHDDWVDVARTLCQPTLRVLHQECATVTDEVVSAVTAFKSAQEAARAPIAETVRAYEEVCTDLLEEDQRREAHCAAVRKDHLRAQAKLCAAEAKRAAEEALVQRAHHHASLRRAAERDVETYLNEKRAAERIRLERGAVDQHLARQAQRFQRTSSRLAERRRVASALTYGTHDSHAWLAVSNTSTAPSRQPDYACSVPGRGDRGVVDDHDGLVHSRVVSPPRCVGGGNELSQWLLYRDLAALHEGAVPQSPL